MPVSVLNAHNEDGPHISLTYLYSLLENRSLRIEHLYAVTFPGQQSSRHIVATLTDGRYVCDCAMGSNLGLVCRHFFAVMAKSNAKFHIGFIRSRWFQNPAEDVSEVAPVTCRVVLNEMAAASLGTSHPTNMWSYPLNLRSGSSPNQNPTLPRQTIYHTANDALRDMIPNVTTQEQLDELVQDLIDLRYAHPIYIV